MAKYLVLVSKPVYIGVYVALEAESDQDALKRLEMRVESDDEFRDKLTDLFGEMRCTAHSMVNIEHNGFINAMDDDGAEVSDGRHHPELDMKGVVSPERMPQAEKYFGISADRMAALDLTNPGYRNDAQMKVAKMRVALDGVAV